jgi:hypothetical protein
MTVTIPVWIFWVLGSAAGLFVLVLAAVGFLTIRFVVRSGGFKLNW